MAPSPKPVTPKPTAPDNKFSVLFGVPFAPMTTSQIEALPSCMQYISNPSQPCDELKYLFQTVRGYLGNNLVANVASISVLNYEPTSISMSRKLDAGRSMFLRNTPTPEPTIKPTRKAPVSGVTYSEHRIQVWTI